jgi:2-O-(6-phospho-alpha-D-mannosyl)-D-glycerate hydrolase
VTAATEKLAGRRFWVVPHTHWDREWYVPFEQFRLRLAVVVDDVLDALERDERLRFVLDGQTIVLEDYLELRPENEERLSALVRAGRVEIGPSYELPDEYLVGQEALVRNLLAGRRDCERYGVRSTAGYAPDTFGHVAQLPQVFLGFGLDNIVFARGLGDEAETLGALFRWRGFDGSELLAIRQLGNYDNALRLPGPERVLEFWDEFGGRVEQVGLEDVLLCNGTDHEPLQADLPAVLDACETALPGASFRIGVYSEYVAAVRPLRDGLELHEGELCGARERPVLRGVNSARMYLKQLAEETERLLLTAETLASLAVLAGRLPSYRFPQAELALAWRDLLRNHPHDSIGGCSVDQVHRDMLQRFDAARVIGEALRDEAAAALAGRVPEWRFGLPYEGRDWTIVNPLPWARRGVVEAGGGPVAVELPGFGATGIRTGRSGRPVGGAVLAGPAIENGVYHVEAAADGTLTVRDLETGGSLAGLHAFEDSADCGDEYTYCPVAGDEPLRAGPARIRTRAAGPRAELELVHSLLLPAALTPGRSARSGRLVRCPVTTRVRLDAGSERVEIRTTVDNRVRNHRLRVLFPSDSASGHVRVESHFALLERQARLPDGEGWCEPPIPTHHTLGLVAAGPLALFTRGLPEYEAVETEAGLVLALTLLRSVGWLSRDDLVTRPGNAGPPIATPAAQCPGRHTFEYALSLRAERRSAAELVREAQDYRFGFVVAPGPCPSVAPPLAIGGEGFCFAALKGAEAGEGFALRLYNPSAGERATVTIDRAAERCRLDETGGEPVRFPLELAPGRIETLRFAR